MKLSRLFSIREKVLLTILAVLLLGALYLFLVQMPVSSGIESATMATESLELENSILEAKALKIYQMEEELKNIDSDDPFVPEYDNLKNVIAFLNNTIASTSDYTLDFSQISVGEEDHIARRGYTLTFNCDSYAQAKKVIETLENCEYICRISNLVISDATENSKNPIPITDGQVKVSLTDTFYERA